MKRVLQKASAVCNKNICRLLFLFLFCILTINLSGQKIQTLLSETWTSGNWVKSTQMTYTYDVNGNTLTSLSQIWDIPTLSWKDMSRSNFTNNPDGTASVVTSQAWNGSAWNNSSRMTFTYNAAKKIVTEVSEIWVVAVWQNLSRQTNTYDGSGYLTNNLSQMWDMISSAWKNSAQTTYTNYPNGTVNFETTQTWDGSAWTNSAKTTFTYNPSGKIQTAVTEDWKSGSWQNDSKVTNTYNGNGNIINELYQLWDAGSTSWVNDSQSNYTNNPNGTAFQIIMQEWKVSVWENTQRLTFTYSPSTSISESIKEADYTLYPNPAYNVITIKAKSSIPGSDYSITDQTGKVVQKGILFDEITTLDITTLSNGIYFLKIGERNQNTFKLIKQ